MYQQVRGVIIEGQSCSGKTSLFNAIRKQHGLMDQSERNIIFLSEHYSQTLNYVNGGFINLTPKENAQVLSERLEIIERLGEYADNLGVHTRRSRGLFYVFERFHLNYMFAHNDSDSDGIRKIEKRLSRLNPKIILCTISENKVEERLKHRATYTGEFVTNQTVEDYIRMQEKFIKLSQASDLSVEVLITDGMEWEKYANSILDFGSFGEGENNESFT